MLYVISITERIEQSYCLRFWQKLGDTQAEPIRKIEQVLEMRPYEQPR